jgi:hypothetical protein
MIRSLDKQARQLIDRHIAWTLDIFISAKILLQVLGPQVRSQEYTYAFIDIIMEAALKH